MKENDTPLLLDLGITSTTCPVGVAGVCGSSPLPVVGPSQELIIIAEISSMITAKDVFFIRAFIYFSVR